MDLTYSRSTLVYDARGDRLLCIFFIEFIGTTWEIERERKGDMSLAKDMQTDIRAVFFTQCSETRYIWVHVSIHITYPGSCIHTHTRVRTQPVPWLNWVTTNDMNKKKCKSDFESSIWSIILSVMDTCIPDTCAKISSLWTSWPIFSVPDPEDKHR